MKIEQGSYVSPKESLPKVKEILKHTNLSDDIKDKIMLLHRKSRKL